MTGWLAGIAGLGAALALQLLTEQCVRRVSRSRLSQRQQIIARIPLVLVFMFGAPILAYAVAAALGSTSAGLTVMFADFVLGFVLLEFSMEVAPAITGRIRDSDYRRWSRRGGDDAE